MKKINIFYLLYKEKDKMIAYACVTKDKTVKCVHLNEIDAKRCCENENINMAKTKYVKSKLGITQDVNTMQANMLMNLFHLPPNNSVDVCVSYVPFNFEL